MGTVKVTIAVGSPQGRLFEDLEVTVDTGSTYTAVPRELLRRLGVPVERSLPSETADGRVVPVDVGRTTIRLEGLEFPTPVIFAEEGEPSLLGVVTLEEAALAVDPVEFSKRITLHHTFPLPRKRRSAPASPKRAAKNKARPKVERPRGPVVQDRLTDKETAKQPRAKRTPEQHQEYERARNQTPERREYNRRYAQEQRQKAKELGRCQDCTKAYRHPGPDQVHRVC